MHVKIYCGRDRKYSTSSKLETDKMANVAEDAFTDSVIDII
jgi:hypothetical protein